MAANDKGRKTNKARSAKVALTIAALCTSLGGWGVLGMEQLTSEAAAQAAVPTAAVVADAPVSSLVPATTVPTITLVQPGVTTATQSAPAPTTSVQQPVARTRSSR